MAQSDRAPDPSTVAEAAQALRRILVAIDQGEIDAEDPKARALLRRLEGAVAAWDDVVGKGAVERE
jgi:hypothetical protein